MATTPTLGVVTAPNPTATCTVRLRDGTRVKIRPVQPDDRSLMLEFMTDLDARSRRLRFFTAAANLGVAADWATSADGSDHVGLLALDETGRLAGHAACCRMDAGRAEVAVEISDHNRHQGLATILIAKLARRAEALGILTFIAEVLPENRDMLAVFHDGFDAQQRFEDSEVDIEFPTSAWRLARYGLAEMPDPATDVAPRVRIVLADDHAVVRVGLRMLLDAEPGFEVVAEAGNTRDAARFVRGHHPDVLVLDLNMPGESGLELIPRICEETPDTRIVVLTMQRGPAFARQALSSGAMGYVIKDAADVELVEAVRLAATGRHYLNPQLGARLAATPADARPGDLSEREVEILRLISLGHTNPEIAGQLFLSVRTIEAHRAHIHQKLDLSTRAELVRFALEHGLVTLPDADT